MVDYQGMEKLKELFDVFQWKWDFLGFMNNCVNSDGIQIFIGQEFGFKLFDECSLVFFIYGIEDEVLGVFVVIGFICMFYQ